ncbi:putative ATP-dependent RNA helicase DEAH13 [Paratrimastix pyriformis]|uniref:ATP-dependent RNA helicase DEAH13 n=1 Tax=Paratrimastix pyriformis TaxID=342808 RepID=A0ABQ8UIW9_9EUKA|nr:putative ATP-dependent RNA helicase DEAH13 [Paratrimastix pyriformis]
MPKQKTGGRAAGKERAIKRSAKIQQRAELLDTLSKSTLPPETLQLFQSSFTLGMKQTKKDKLHLALLRHRKGLGVDPDVHLMHEVELPEAQEAATEAPAIPVAKPKKKKRTRDGATSKDAAATAAATATPTTTGTTVTTVTTGTTIKRRPEIEEKRAKLPIYNEEATVMEEIKEHNVVVICGETGCGKTTQVPQFLWEAGFGWPGSGHCGRVGVTQPRRVAAVAMARRVADELCVAPGGGEVAFQIRYDSTVSPSTRLKFMTDGILLREVQADFLLSQYSAIVVDEAHERSINTGVALLAPPCLGLLSSRPPRVPGQRATHLACLAFLPDLLPLLPPPGRTTHHLSSHLACLAFHPDILLGLLSRVVAARAALCARAAKRAPKALPPAPAEADASPTPAPAPVSALADPAALGPLKLVVMSATLRTEDFVGNKALFPFDVPLISVPGILIFLTGRTEIEALVRRLRETFPAPPHPGQQQQQQSRKPGKKQPPPAATSGPAPAAPGCTDPTLLAFGDAAAPTPASSPAPPTTPAEEPETAAPFMGDLDALEERGEAPVPAPEAPQAPASSSRRKGSAAPAPTAAPTPAAEPEQPEGGGEEGSGAMISSMFFRGAAQQPAASRGPVRGIVLPGAPTQQAAAPRRRQQSHARQQQQAKLEAAEDEREEDEAQRALAERSAVGWRRGGAQTQAEEDEEAQEDSEEDEVTVLYPPNWKDDQTAEAAAAAAAGAPTADGGRARRVSRAEGVADLAEGAPMDEAAPTPVHVLPLYSMLPGPLQMRVFQETPPNARLIVVATNVAETSLTIPGIRYVIDAGRMKQKFLPQFNRSNLYARLIDPLPAFPPLQRQYRERTGMSSFEVEWVSQASADQRAGRAGRVAPGHCYRLFSSAVFNDHFAKFTEPEILRTPLDGVLLQMKAMGIPDVESFPSRPCGPSPSFHALPCSPSALCSLLSSRLHSPPVSTLLPSPLSSRLHSPPLLLLLGALREVPRPGGRTGPLRTINTEITPLGRLMARLPVAPRFAKMLILSIKPALTAYMVAAVAALSVREMFMFGPAHTLEGADEGKSPEEDEQAAAERAEAEAAAEAARQQKEGGAAKKRKTAWSLWGHPDSDVLGMLRAVGAFAFQFCGGAQAEAVPKTGPARGRGAQQQQRRPRGAAGWGTEPEDPAAAEEFCKESFLRYKALTEVQEMRVQLGQLMAEIEHDLLHPGPDGAPAPAPAQGSPAAQERARWVTARTRELVRPSLPPPSPQQEVLLRQIVAGGLVDRVAVRDPTAVPDGRRVPYMTPAMKGTPIYLHPNCFVLGQAPEAVVYTDLVATARPYMKARIPMRPPHSSH